MASFPPDPLSYYTGDLPKPFNGRRKVCIAFGVVMILFGALSGCFTLLIPLALLAPSPAVKSFRTIVPAMLVYAVLATAFIWLGTGAIKLRRWVRPLMFWGSVIIGYIAILALITLAVTEQAIKAQITSGTPAGRGLPAGATLTIAIASFLVTAFFGVVVPAAYAWFYWHSDTKQMLEYYDPTPRWTDRCPLPVMGAPIALASYALMTLLALTVDVPFFSTLLHGGSAVVFRFAEMLVALVLAWLMYRQSRAGWWGTLGFLLLLILMTGWFALSRGTDVMYSSEGLTEAQIRMTHIVRVYTPMIWVINVLRVAICLAYLLYIRRYFVARPAPALVEAAAVVPE